MSTAAPRRRTYDPNILRLVAEGQGDDIVRQLNIPCYTVSGWKRRPLPPVVSVGTPDEATEELQARICKLEQRVKVLTRIMVLLLTLVRISKLTLNNTRVPNPDDRARLLRAIHRSEDVVPKRIALHIIGLSPSRYGQWNRQIEQDCPIDDSSQCPRTQPGQLTPEEVGKMREMVTAPEYRHVPTSILAILAQRIGKVFASASTWCRYVRQRGWRRLRRLVHPCKPTTGVRATSPNGLWHVDTSVLRLLDGTHIYLRAMIVNPPELVLSKAKVDSRRILAWSLTSKLDHSNRSLWIVGGLRDGFHIGSTKVRCMLLGVELFQLIDEEQDLASGFISESLEFEQERGWAFLKLLGSVF